MTSPLYLRDLALKFAATARPRDLAIAERLRAIADELDGVVQDRQPAPPPAAAAQTARLIAGTDLTLARLRRAAQAEPPTPAQLEELRNLRKQGKP